VAILALLGFDWPQTVQLGMTIVEGFVTWRGLCSSEGLYCRMEQVLHTVRLPSKAI